MLYVIIGVNKAIICESKVNLLQKPKTRKKNLTSSRTTTICIHKMFP
jgi:hypothetical protein